MTDDMSSFEFWSEEDDSALEFELLPDWHPSLFVDVFRVGLQNFNESTEAIARGGFVTPESVDVWGDFTAAREIANSNLKISMTALWGIGAPDVAYVRLVDTEEWRVADMRTVPAAAIVTLIWRPEIAIIPGTSWRIHAIGDPIHPDEVPRTAAGIDPRRLS
jgi:hypothetical protein